MYCAETVSSGNLIFLIADLRFTTSLLFCFPVLLTGIIAALCGNYVNFGVFELYGDRALADALDVSLKMSLSVPLSDISAFKKVLFFATLEDLFSCFAG